MVHYKKTLKIAWETLLRSVDLLTVKISNEQFDLIVGVGRGGLIPATILSYRLHTPLGVIMAQSYKERKQTNFIASSLSTVVSVPKKPKILLVDELTDTGKTLQHLKKYLKKLYPGSVVKTAVVFDKQRPPVSDFFVRHLPQYVWLEMPFEKSFKVR